MKNLTILLLIILTHTSVDAQNGSRFNINISDSTEIVYSIKELTQRQFEASISDLLQEKSRYDVDSSNDKWLSKLSNASISDSCIVITHRGNDLKLCNRKNESDERNNERFRILDYKCENVIIQNEGYEWRRYVVVNNANYFILPDAPLFIDCNRIYSYGNYYAEGQFKYWDMASGKSMGFDTLNYSLKSCYRDGEMFYIAFTSSDDSEKKFIELTIE